MAAQSIQHVSQEVDFLAPMFTGIEKDFNVIEIRLALIEYMKRPRPDWRIHLPVTGRA